MVFVAHLKTTGSTTFSIQRFFYQVIIILLSCGLYFSMICKCGMIFNRLLLPPSSLLHPLLQPTPSETAEEVAKLSNQITLMKIEEFQALVNSIRYSKDVLMRYNPSFQTHFCTLWDLIATNPMYYLPAPQGQIMHCDLH